MADLRDLHDAFARLEELIPNRPLETLPENAMRRPPSRGRVRRHGWANPIIWGAVAAATVVAATVGVQREWHDDQQNGTAPATSTATTHPTGLSTRPTGHSSAPTPSPSRSVSSTRTRASSSVPTTTAPPTTPTTSTPASTKSPASGTYRTYGGAKFGFSLQVPADYTAVDPGHDDPTFLRSPDHRVTVTPYQTFNGDVPPPNTCLPAHVTPGDTPSQWLAALSKDYTDTGGVVTYVFVQGPVVVISGLQHGKVYYERDVVYSHVIYGVVWAYPAALKHLVDPALQESVRTFRPGPNCLR